MSSTTARTAHRPPTSRHHLHEVLTTLDAHVDDTTSPWRRLMYLNGAVTIETEPDDLIGLCATFGLDPPIVELPASAAGDDWAVVGASATGRIDGSPLRIWARTLISRAQYEAMLTDHSDHSDRARPR